MSQLGSRHGYAGWRPRLNLGSAGACTDTLVVGPRLPAPRRCLPVCLFHRGALLGPAPLHGHDRAATFAGLPLRLRQPRELPDRGSRCRVHLYASSVQPLVDISDLHHRLLERLRGASFDVLWRHGGAGADRDVEEEATRENAHAASGRDLSRLPGGSAGEGRLPPKLGLLSDRAVLADRSPSEPGRGVAAISCGTTGVDPVAAVSGS
mmetsp:Transcript_32479/g.52261  ORF Transcript_32479/g.52261 Transcript_32479/m.52261 type:complete len:208 (-) Transcript_32479:62-685(-)